MNEDAEPQLIVVGGKRGRPKSAEPLTPVTAWVPPGVYDNLVKMAERRGESLSSTVSVLLQVKWKHSPKF